MPRLNLNPSHRAEVKSILNQQVPGIDVWAYGSRVNGRAHEMSDLDLVLRNQANPEKPVEHMASLKQAFKDSNLPILVDVMDWAYLPESYREEILRCYVSF